MRFYLMFAFVLLSDSFRAGFSGWVVHYFQMQQSKLLTPLTGHLVSKVPYKNQQNMLPDSGSTVSEKTKQILN